MMLSNRRFIYVILLAGISLLIWNCSHKASKPPKIPKTGNAPLDSLLRSAPITTINIDHFQVDTVVANNENVMGRNSGPRIEFPDPLGRIKGLVKIGDSLYIGDQQRNCIWVMDNRGRWIRKIGRKGKGPGEFEDLYSIFRNSNNIFTTDLSNARIQIYDKHFHLKTFFYQEVFGGGFDGRHVAVTDSLLFLPVSFFAYGKLILVRRANPPYDSLFSFWPRLIPPGSQPSYNGYYIDVNSHKELAIAYTGLPYIFILNKDRTITHIINVKSASYKNPSPKPIHKIARDASEAIGIHGFMHNLFLANNGSLYFFTGKNFYQIAYDPQKQSYRLKKIMHFTYGDIQLPKMSSNQIGPCTSITIDNDTLYFGSIWNQYIFRFALK